jgi:phospholipase C
VTKKLVALSLVVLIASIIGFTGCGTASGSGNNGSGNNNGGGGATPTVTLVASQATINSGQSVTLTWTSTNATTLTIDNGVGAVTGANGSVNVTPTATVTYTITAANGSKTATATAAVTVNPAPQPATVSITTSPSTVAATQPYTLTWTSANATAVTISPSINGDDPAGTALNGSATLIGAHTTTYTITATGTDGSKKTATATETVVVATLTASATTINSGGSVDLTYATESATTASIDNGIGTLPAATGKVTVKPTQTTTYTLTAVNGAVTATATVTVEVNTALNVTLAANPMSVVSGGAATLSWTANAATSLSIDNGVGAVSGATGQVTVNPTQTTTYTITATDAGGATQTATATVTVVVAGMENIKHIIFMVQENRTFDNYFSKMNEYRAGKGLSTDVDVADNSVVLPTYTGGTHTPFHQRTMRTENLSPSWDESHYDIHKQSNGTYKMDRFMLTTHSVAQKYDNDGLRAVGYYDDTDLPYYYELATQYAMSDTFHSSLLSNSQPNRLYLFGATTQGRIKPDNGGHPLWPIPTIFNTLQNGGVKWGYYYQDNIFLAGFEDWNNPAIRDKTQPIQKYYDILASPTADKVLPQVVFIEQSSSTGLDEHPDNNIQQGAADVQQIIDALQKSSAWGSSVFILTYDEGGGLYDHVPPFKVVAPDDYAPMLTSTNQPGDFTDSGFRIPFIMVSPWVKPNFVSHVNRETTSILKLIETRFNLPSLTRRDQAADDLTEFFDFVNPPRLAIPKLPVQPTNGIDDQKIEAIP